MKTFIIGLLLIIVITACNNTTSTPEISSINALDEILNSCEGHAIVVAKGYNEENFDAYKHLLIIKNTKTNKTYEYFGGKYGVNVGDTLK